MQPDEKHPTDTSVQHKSPPYRHIPIHAASDALSQAPPGASTWADRRAIREQYNRRSDMERQNREADGSRPSGPRAPATWHGGASARGALHPPLKGAMPTPQQQAIGGFESSSKTLKHSRKKHTSESVCAKLQSDGLTASSSSSTNLSCGYHPPSKGAEIVTTLVLESPPGHPRQNENRYSNLSHTSEDSSSSYSSHTLLPCSETAPSLLQLYGQQGELHLFTPPSSISGSDLIEDGCTVESPGHKSVRQKTVSFNDVPTIHLPETSNHLGRNPLALTRNATTQFSTPSIYESPPTGCSIAPDRRRHAALIRGPWFP